MNGGLFKSASRFALVAAAGVMGAMSAQAADLGGNCCADLEERVAELEATTARKGNRKVKLTVSGQVNEALIFWDDGAEKNAYVVSNNNSRSRFRFVGDAKINADWSAGYLLEIGVRYANSGNRDQTTGRAGGDSNSIDIRHSAWWLDSKTLGRVWVGQTSSATDGIAEINLANVVNAGSDPSSWVGGFQFRNSNGSLSGVRWNAATPSFNGAWNAGEGDRNNVVKYVSPTFVGFTFSTAWGEDDMADFALRYAGEFSGFRLAAGVGYKIQRDNTGKAAAALNGANGSGSADGPACADLSNSANVSAVDCTALGLSASVMHIPTGLFVTGSYGYIDDANRVAKFKQGVAAGGAAAIGNVKDRDEHWYIQGGIEQNWFGIGKSTLYGEYGLYQTGAGLNATGQANNAFTGVQNGQAFLASAETKMWGLGFNQEISAAAMDMYVSYRNFEADLKTSATGTSAGQTKANVNDFQAVMMGAIIRF
jgi:hypothetical protein